ncbi:MAG: chemotaxis protein CheC [Fimbriimonadales bacterium]|nr:chemotaxis protein CheC [Fimbriimonadales bacterium]
MPEIILEEEEVDILREIANIGSGHAAASMEKWLERDMLLDVPQAFLVPVEEVAEHIGDPLQTVICVYSRVSGEITGHLLYTLALEDAKVLLDILLDPEDRKWGFSPDNLSAIAETGNILFNAYLTAVSRISGLELYPGTPACAADMLEAVVNTVLLEICEGSENTLVLESQFRGEGLSSVGYVLFLAENEALKRLVQRAEGG